MRKGALMTAVGLAAAFALPAVALAVQGPYVYQGQDYYVVEGNNPNLNTGAKVCAAVGKTCVGYTAYTNAVCSQVHPTASVTQSVNGSKAGFYCNGAPQTGLACGSLYNNCQVCPQCNVNADCNFDISGLFNEMYVQCGTNAISSTPSITSATPGNGWIFSLWTNLWNSARNAWHGFKGIFSFFHWMPTVPTIQTIQTVTTIVQTTTIMIPPHTLACDFYQFNAQKVTCGAYKAADTFCALVMQSRFATAASCNNKGLILCTLPCGAQGANNLKSCAYDPARGRGAQAAPLSSCP